MSVKAKQVVEALLETDDSCVGKPITGVEYQGRKYVFYPYAGPTPAWRFPHYFGGKVNDGILGYIKTRQGNMHGRFYQQGQFFRFEQSESLPKHR